MTKLTHASAKDCLPGTTLWDDAVTGLHLRAGATCKTWAFYYRTRAGIERRPKLGRFPQVSLQDARKLAKELDERIRRGEDPSAQWQASKDVPTVAELCDRYLKEWAEVRMKDKSVEQHRQLIESQIKPGLGKRLVTDVRSTDIDKFLNSVYNRQFVGSNDGRGETAHWTALHTKRLLSKIFKRVRKYYGITLEENPMEDTRVFGRIKRTRHATEEELPRIAAALKRLAEKDDKGKRRAACLWTMFLTGGRVTEIRDLTGEQLHSEGGMHWLILKDHKTFKTIGEKSIALPVQASALINQLPAVGKKEKVFGDISKRLLENVWADVRRDAGIEGLKMLDARRTFASFALSHNVTLHQVGELLGHTDVETTKGYSYLIKSSKFGAASVAADAITKASERNNV